LGYAMRGISLGRNIGSFCPVRTPALPNSALAMQHKAGQAKIRSGDNSGHPWLIDNTMLSVIG
jgi:hypothetical protein